MQYKLPFASRMRISSLFLFCVCLLSLSLTGQPGMAQEQEAGSTTGKAAEQSGVDLPDSPTAETSDSDSEKPKKDERPRELGVMILIVWLLAGAGIGILIFTSLFGHSIRSMIRRPYPNQMHPPRKEQPDVPVETSTEAETGDEKPES
ncbi:MAG: hypothetical protein KDA74_12525 [Planctomycetaceae bacterium]|nr:hypothetical protein [Planctomycetaceae bacterium]